MKVPGIPGSAIDNTASVQVVVDGAAASAANPLPAGRDSLIDANNTSTATLAGGATFTGAWTDTLGVLQVVVRFTADVAGTCYFESSSDGVNVSGSAVQLNSSSTFTIAPLTPTLRYYRVRYVNGAAAQGSFSLCSRINRTWAEVTSSAVQTVNDYSRVSLVRQITDPRLDETLGRHADRQTVLKFGANPSVGAGTLEVIWSLGGAYTGFITSAKAVRIRAGGNAADTADGLGARAVVVEGLDSTGAQASATLTTAGASASDPSAGTFLRIFRAYVVPGGTYSDGLTGANTGAIVIETSDGASVMANITAGRGQTQMCIYTVPAGKRALIRALSASSDSTKAAAVRWYQRQDITTTSAPMASRRLIYAIEGLSGYAHRPFDSYLGPFPALTDIWAVGEGPTGGGAMSADMDIVLVDV